MINGSCMCIYLGLSMEVRTMKSIAFILEVLCVHILPLLACVCGGLDSENAPNGDHQVALPTLNLMMVESQVTAHRQGT